ncbi:MAG: 30S ribosomal protein S6 [Eubacteriaceae bacterium]|nr:30S ribosomal protein S6 [Eubacteriaceae bacterium]
MQSYETLFITHPDLTPEESSLLTERVKNVITTNGGELGEVEEWGKRRLAYEIRKVRDGYFNLVYFSGPKEVLDELNHIYKITENILRGIVVKNEKK